VTNHPQKGHAHTHTHTHIPGHEELNRGYFTHFTTHTHTRSRTVEPQSIDTLHTLLHTLSHFNRGHACRRYFAHTLLHTLYYNTHFYYKHFTTHTHIQINFTVDTLHTLLHTLSHFTTYTHIHTRCHEQWSPLETIHCCRRYSYCCALLLLYYCVTTHTYIRDVTNSGAHWNPYTTAVDTATAMLYCCFTTALLHTTYQVTNSGAEDTFAVDAFNDIFVFHAARGSRPSYTSYWFS
jgi:hypothetical protein